MRSLADLGVVYVDLDGFALGVRSAGKVVSVTVLGVVGVLPDGHKHLFALELYVSLVAGGQIKLRRIDGWRKIHTVLSHHTTVAA